MQVRWMVGVHRRRNSIPVEGRSSSCQPQLAVLLSERAGVRSPGTASALVVQTQSLVYCRLHRQRMGPLLVVNGRYTVQPLRRAGIHCALADIVVSRDWPEIRASESHQP